MDKIAGKRNSVAMLTGRSSAKLAEMVREHSEGNEIEGLVPLEAGQQTLEAGQQTLEAGKGIASEGTAALEAGQASLTGGQK